MKLSTASKYTRQNTGRHMCDSGDIYGRHYDSPVPEKAVYHDGFDSPATISTTHMLANNFEFTKAHEDFYNWLRYSNVDANLSWCETIQEFFKDYGFWQCVARDNTYNSENDLDQCFIWEVWQAEHLDGDDWIYGESDGLNYQLILQIHTGCDVRGGYSRPLFVEYTGDDYILPVDLSAQYYCELLDDNENWQCGYSSYPYGEIEKAGFKFEGRSCGPNPQLIFVRDDDDIVYKFDFDLPWSLQG